MEKTNNYWNGNGRFQALVAKLQLRVQLSGSVENAADNPALEKFRKASCVYYDVFNNGLCNRAREFKPIFGFAASKYQYTHYHPNLGHRVSIDFDAIVIPMDKVMDRIILLAALEQDLIEEVK